LVAAAKFLVAATKILFVVPSFVAVTKPFFPCTRFNYRNLRAHTIATTKDSSNTNTARITKRSLHFMKKSCLAPGKVQSNKVYCLPAPRSICRARSIYSFRLLRGLPSPLRDSPVPVARTSRIALGSREKITTAAALQGPSINRSPGQRKRNNIVLCA